MTDYGSARVLSRHSQSRQRVIGGGSAEPRHSPGRKPQLLPGTNFRRNEASFPLKGAGGFPTGLMPGPQQDPRTLRCCLSRRPTRRSWRLCSPGARPKPAAAERPREPCPWRHRVWRLPAFRQPPRQRFCASPHHWPLAFSHIPGDSFGPRKRLWHINAESQCGLRPQERARPERGVLETPLSEPRPALHPIPPRTRGEGPG